MKLDPERYAVFVAFITSFFAVFLSAGIVLGVPAIAEEFGMNNVIQNWIITLAALVIAVFTLPAGQISGKIGVKKTLIIGVSIFYMFNSIGTQGIMEDVSKSGNENVQMLIKAIGIVSVAVAIVLGLLIIYANNFLIKRRKKEFGIYMLLGMGKKKVSKILVYETCIVGFISLIVGLFVGIFGSQLLSIIVAKMFAVDVTGYTFAVSGKAAIITVISFVAIFFIVLLFNTRMVSKYKLIDLINAEKKGEKQIIKNTKVSIALFIISAVLLVIAYAGIGIFGNRMRGREFAFAAGVVVIGTFVLFWSFAGFFQTVLSKNKGYKKGSYNKNKHYDNRKQQKPAPKKTFWQRVKAFFGR